MRCIGAGFCDRGLPRRYSARRGPAERRSADPAACRYRDLRRGTRRRGRDRQCRGGAGRLCPPGRYPDLHRGYRGGNRLRQRQTDRSFGRCGLRGLCRAHRQPARGCDQGHPDAAD